MSQFQAVVESNFDEQIEKLKELVGLIDKTENKVTALQFISIKDLAKAMNTTEKTAQEYFNEPDFPCTDFPKEKKAEIHAVIKYFSVPRRKKK